MEMEDEEEDDDDVDIPQYVEDFEDDGMIDMEDMDLSMINPGGDNQSDDEGERELRTVPRHKVHNQINLLELQVRLDQREGAGLQKVEAKVRGGHFYFVAYQLICCIIFQARRLARR